MFSGSYMILDVNHKISPGSFMTTFTGIRQNAARLPELDDYLQILKVNLLKSIQDNVIKNQRDKSSGSTGNSISNKNNASNSATNKNSTTLSANQSCKPNDKYSKFELFNSNKSKYKTTEVIKKLNEVLGGGNESLKIKTTIFCSFYWGSYDDKTFNAYGENLSSVVISQDWAALGDQYFSKKYYCSSSNDPMAVFENLEKLIQFFNSKWSQIINTEIKTIDEKSVTRFLLLYSESKIKTTNEYNQINKDNLKVLEDFTKKAINLFNSASQGISP